jgi:hypothetical protein
MGMSSTIFLLTPDQYIIVGIITVILVFAELGMETISPPHNDGGRWWAQIPRWAARGAVLGCLFMLSLTTLAGSMG